MKILIDGDLLLYKAGFGAQSQGRDIPPSHSCHNLDSLIKGYIEYLKPLCNIKSVSVFITSDDKSNYRYSIQDTVEYKANRKGMEKPVHFHEMRTHLVKKYKAHVISGQEADDAMGIEATKDPYNTMIVSADKDMNMIPGWHWKMNREDPPFLSSERGYLQLIRAKGNKVKLKGTGELWFWAQCLLGDRVDNIPGLPGYGDVKVYKLLHDKSSSELRDTVLDLYITGGLSEDDLSERAQMLWIRKQENEKWELKKH